MFGLKSRNRKKLKAGPFAAEWEEVLCRNIPYYKKYPADWQARLRQHIQVFMAEKRFEGCAGLEITDEMRVTIAAQACTLLLGHEHTDYYPKVKTILVYPDAFGTPGKRNSARLGEAWKQDLVILSWKHVLAGGKSEDDGENVAFHEFAHQLDGEDGVFDGTPPLPAALPWGAWSRILTREYKKLRRLTAKDEAAFLDGYGASNPAEFFAVVTESFFEQPRELKIQHRELYEVLKVYYNQDPVRLRMRRKAGKSGEKAPVSFAAAKPGGADVLENGRRVLRLVVLILVLDGLAFLIFDSRLAWLVLWSNLLFFILLWLVCQGVIYLAETRSRYLARLQAPATRRLEKMKLELVRGRLDYGVSRGCYEKQLKNLDRLGFSLLVQYRDPVWGREPGLAYVSCFVSADNRVVLSIGHMRPRFLIDLFAGLRRKGAWDRVWFDSYFEGGQRVETQSEMGVDLAEVYRRHCEAAARVEREQGVEVKLVKKTGQLLGLVRRASADGARATAQQIFN